jgi:hypothetical protein
MWRASMPIPESLTENTPLPSTTRQARRTVPPSGV